MTIDLHEIGPGGLSFDQRLGLAEIEGRGAERFGVSNAVIRGEAHRGEHGVDLRAHLVARVQLACSRCTEPVTIPIATEFGLTLVPDAVEYAAGETEVDAEDARIYYAAGGKADLNEIASEQIYLNLPLKPVCSESCKGLCPECGANRNEGDCGCRSEKWNPAFEPLRTLKNRG